MWIILFIIAFAVVMPVLLHAIEFWGKRHGR